MSQGVWRNLRVVGGSEQRFGVWSISCLAPRLLLVRLPFAGAAGNCRKSRMLRLCHVACARPRSAGGHGAGDFFFLLFKKNNIFSPLSLPFLKRERDITHRTTAKLSADPPTCIPPTNTSPPINMHPTYQQQGRRRRPARTGAKACGPQTTLDLPAK